MLLGGKGFEKLVHNFIYSNANLESEGTKKRRLNNGLESYNEKDNQQSDDENQELQGEEDNNEEVFLSSGE